MRLLVIHQEPDEIRDIIEPARAPGDEVQYVDDLATLGDALAAFPPDAVFSIKHSAFPGPLHRPALLTPTVRWFHVGGAGTEHLGAWDPTRVRVTNSVGVLAPFHAERALAGLLALSTGLLEQRRAQAERRWVPTRFNTLAGRRLLIVGYGATGRALAQRARALGLYIIGVRRDAQADEFADEVHPAAALDTLWARADVVSINVPSRAETHHTLDAVALAQLPRGALVLNGARGAVVDQTALSAALQSGQVGGAWLDVFDPEPLGTDDALWTMPHVIVSAHCADQVADFPRRFAHFFTEQWVRYREGEMPAHLVSP